MLPVVVIPCLNEAENLAETVRSLGFVPGCSDEMVLVLVDNGSTDATRPLMDTIARELPPGAVTIVSEPERGFVPARRSGTDAVAALAVARGIPEDAVLVVQGDADTRYAPGYCSALAAAAESLGTGLILEACNVPPADPNDTCVGFDALAASVDERSSWIFADPSFDVVIDDKVAAYRLSDYRRWGGHVQECDADGDEMFAETTRLFLRARLMDARRVTVAEASAETSCRAIVAEPALAFSTAGYPRGRRWIERWRARYRGAAELSAFQPPMSQPQLQEAVFERTRHLLALFCVLPRLVERQLAPDANDEARGGVLDELRLPDIPAVTARPSLLLETALAISDSHVKRLLRRLNER